MVALPWDSLDFWCFLAVAAIASFRLKKIHWSVAVATFAVLFSAIFAAHGRFYGGAPLVHFNYIRLISFQALATFFVVYIAAEGVNLGLTLRAFFIANFVNSLYVIYQFMKFHDGFTSGGLLFNSSMNSSFIALSIPFAPVWAIPALLVAVFCAKASVPVLVAATVLLFRFSKLKHIPFAICAAAIITGAGFLHDKEFLNGSGRFENWDRSMQYWDKNIHPVIGAGAGTYRFLGSIITEERKTTEKLQMQEGLVFATMHNDILQILFECGWTGFVACTVALGHAIWFARNNAKILSSLLGFCVFASFNMPLRYVPTAFFGAILLLSAFKLRGKCNE